MGNDTKPELERLQEAIKFFADPERARLYFVARRWPDGVTRPRCGSDNIAWQPKYDRWQCNVRHPKADSLPARPARSLRIAPCLWKVDDGNVDALQLQKRGSSYEIHRDIGVARKSAWFMMHRIRLAMHEGSFMTKLGGSGKEVEADETFIGGKARTMHKSVKASPHHWPRPQRRRQE